MNRGAPCRARPHVTAGRGLLVGHVLHLHLGDDELALQQAEPSPGTDARADAGHLLGRQQAE
ncbi:MAG TPA: hypothetical protein VIR16_10125 [Candidatus Limnocylindrales bacterium]